MESVEHQLWNLARKWLATTDPEFLTAGMPGHPQGFRPATDVVELEGEIRIVVEIPGLGVGDVEVVVEQGALMIRGRRLAPHHPRGRYLRKEIRCGAFVVVVPLPCAVEPESSSGQIADGFLHLSLRKKRGEFGVRRILVRVGT
jgi:HSP20 family molecular chaperone IbpA